MEQQSSFFCPTCTEQVPVQNRTIHSAICPRHTANTPPTETRPETDRISTETNLAECTFCSLPILLSNLDAHEEHCGTQTALCPLCTHRVRNRDMPSHHASSCEIGATDRTHLLFQNNPSPPLASTDDLAQWAPVAVIAGTLVAAGFLLGSRRR